MKYRQKTILTGALIVLVLIMGVPFTAATYNFSNGPGENDILVATAFTNETKTYGTLEQISNAPDGDFTFSELPDGEYKLYFSYWIPEMTGWGVGDTTVTIENGETLENLLFNGTLLYGDNDSYLWPQAEALYDSIVNGTVIPVSGSGSISGTAGFFDSSDTATDYMKFARGAAIGLWKVQEEEEEENVLPVANFSSNVTAGNPPLTVQFTDNSTGANSWSWDLNGDGIEDSNETNPKFTYTETGTYNVSLTVSNTGGSDTETKSDYIYLCNPLFQPGENDILVAKGVTNATKTYGSFENILSSSDGDFAFSDLPDGEYEIYFSYWIPIMASWGVGKLPVTIEDGQAVEGLLFNGSTLSNDDCSFMWPQAETLKDKIDNGTVTPVSGSGSISGTAGYFNSTGAPSAYMYFARNASIGLWKVAEEKEEETEVNVSLASSTFLGGNGDESITNGNKVSVANDGTVYVIGSTDSTDIPVTTGVYQTSLAGSTDLFIARYNSDMSELLACTYFGGTGSETRGCIKIGFDGSVYVHGSTTSSDLPATGSYSTMQSGTNTFVAKFDSSLSSLQACTNMGGLGHDYAYAINVLDDEIYITGSTKSVVMATAGAYQTSYDFDSEDIFVAKLNNSLGVIAYTYLGSDDDEVGVDIEFGSDGTVYLLADVKDNGMATTGAYDDTSNGNYDTFVANFDSSLSTLLAGTYFGGGEDERSNDLEVGSDGCIYISGRTKSGVLATSGAFETEISNTSTWEGYVAKFDSSLETLYACTYFGGNDNDYLSSVVVADDNVFITGYTESIDIPTTTSGTNSGDNDAFVSWLNDDLSTLLYSTYYGGSDSETAHGSVITETGNLLLCGQTGSVDLPVENAVDDSFNGSSDLFVSRWRVLDESEPKLFFSPEDTTLIDGQTTEIAIKVSSLPDGLSGYELTVNIADSAIAQIVDITYPEWSTITDNSSLPGSSVYLKTVDLERDVQVDATGVILATLTVEGKKAGNTNISLDVSKLESDDGNEINAIVETGTLEVTMMPIPGETASPRDLDGDGLYEDLTGDGACGFVDVEAFFYQMDWIEENMPSKVDYNGNGRVDFDDVVSLFDMV
ncbi:PDK repeat-containing protein [Methanolobus tindarius DSM 2278]|uniref:PDK repeat-containing protein n=1 Tax=Methanolobus tindarius DSM 2278 TaxID=1090322 RepID=W9DP89_METTI|nr:PKD domain-containing protein [Methanolobus tindarius]ETA66900.1 PDK repeat-containing protein [Methanolobus tindarius DSM 2278]